MSTPLYEMLDSLPVAVAVARIPDAYITYVNLALVGLMRAAGPHDLIGSRVVRYLHPDEVDRFGERLAVMASGGLPDEDAQYRFVRLDGTEGVIQVFPLLQGNGEGKLLLTVLLDVTERVQAERERAAAEERYRSLVEMAPEGIGVQVDGRYVLVNQELARMVAARSLDQVVGRPVAEFLAPHERDRLATAIDTTVAQGHGLQRSSFEMLGLDGRVFPVEVSSRRILFDGQPASQAVIREVRSEGSLHGED